MKTTNEILNKALELAKEGKALLFIGSGYSREAKNIKGNKCALQLNYQIK